MIPLAGGSTEAVANALGVVIGVVLVLTLSVLVPRLLGRKRVLPLWLGSVLSGHTEFLLLGLLLGPTVLGWFDETLMGQARPFLVVGLGWVGLFFGLQWDFKKVGRFPRRLFFLSATQAVITFAIVTGLMFAALSPAHEWLGGGTEALPWTRTLLMAGLLGVIASETAPIGIGWLMVARGARGKHTELAQFIAATDAVVSVLLFGLIVSALEPTAPLAVPGLRAISNFALTIGLGLLLGWIGQLILRERWEGPDYLLWLIGLVVFSSGAAHAVGQSPLVVNFLMGLVVVNTTHRSERLTKSLEGAEVPFYMVFLLLAGVSWEFATGGVWILIVPLIAARLIGKVAGFAIARRMHPPNFNARTDLGLTLLSQGGFSVAMVISVPLVVPDAVELAAIETLAIVSICLNQMFSATAAALPLRRAGELHAVQRPPVPTGS